MSTVFPVRKQVFLSFTRTPNLMAPRTRRRSSSSAPKIAAIVLLGLPKELWRGEGERCFKGVYQPREPLAFRNTEKTRFRWL